MEVLIIGAGALGIAIGASLRNRGIGVDFFARGNTANAIRENGIKRLDYFGDIEVPAGQTGVYEDYEALPYGKYDFVIISVKTTANDDVSIFLSAYRECMKDDASIIFMQNGYGYEKPFLRYFDRDMLYHSRVITGFKREKPNESTITAHQAPILIGSLYGNPLDRVQPIADAINATGLPAGTDPDVEKALWAKLIYNTTLNPLGAILGLSYGELAESEYAHQIMDILIEECFEIMNAGGYKTYWSTAEEYRRVLFNEMIPVTGKHRSSTLQDIQKKQKTEIDTLTGALLSIASEYDVNCPVQSMVYWLVKAMEEKF